MKPRKLTTIPPMSRLLPLMPPRKLTVLRLGSLRLASPAPVSWAIRGAESAKANKAIRARRTEPVRVIERFLLKELSGLPTTSICSRGPGHGRVDSKRNRMFSIRDRSVGIQRGVAAGAVSVQKPTAPQTAPALPTAPRFAETG